MNKNFLIAVIVVLIVLCVGEGYFIYKERSEKIAVSVAMQSKLAEMAKPVKRPAPVFFSHGSTFVTNPLASKAYLIAPVTGQLTGDAQKAMTGWDVKQTKNADGSITVSLTPHDTDDVTQQYTVKQGYKLYFLEMTLSDEQNGTDENRGDDVGILVDQNGIVQ